MDALSRAGRTIGVLIVIQMVGGFLVNFVLEAPLFGPPGFLVNAAPHSQQIASVWSRQCCRSSPWPCRSSIATSYSRCSHPSACAS